MYAIPDFPADQFRRAMASSSATLGRALAVMWVGGAAISVAKMTMSMPAGAGAFTLLEAESDWIAAEGARRMRGAARRSENARKLLAEEGAAERLALLSVRDDVRLRLAVAEALDVLLVEHTAVEALVGDKKAAEALERCEECKGARARVKAWRLR